jgi:hypothetical protein
LQVLDLQRNAGNKCFFHITMPLQSGAERLSDMTRYSITFCRKLIIARLDRGCNPMVARQNKSSKGLMDSVISVPVAMDPLIRTILPGSCRTLDFWNTVQSGRKTHFSPESLEEEPHWANAFLGRFWLAS